MGQILFWIEAAVTSALLVALYVALLVRIRSNLGQIGLSAAAGILLSLPWVGVIVVFWIIEAKVGGAALPLAGSILGGSLFAVSAVTIYLRGARKGEDGIRRAASWRLDRLALIAAAAFLLTGMTYWNLDLAVQQEMQALRVEAGATALAVSPPRIPDSQNAAPLYRKAAAVLDASEEGWTNRVADWLSPDEGDFDPSDAEMLAFLDRNAAVLDLLREAANREGCNFGIQYNPPSIWVTIPHLGSGRSLARLMSVAARAKAIQGDMSGAMSDLSVCFAIAEHYSSEPPIVGVLVAVGIESLAFDTLQYVLDQGPVSAEVLDSLEFNPYMDFNALTNRALRMERVAGLSIFIRASDWSTIAQDSFMPGSPGPATASPYRVFLWNEDMHAYLNWMDQYDSLSSQPYFKARQELEQLGEQQYSGRGLGGLVTSIIMPSLWRVPLHAAIADAQHRVALTAQAMLRYRVDHGRWPEQLGDLTPKYMLMVPLDPFTGDSLGMEKRDDGKIVIYSVGPNATYDGGVQYDRKTENGDIFLTLSG